SIERSLQALNERPGAQRARAIADRLEQRLGPGLHPRSAALQATVDDIPTLWLDKDRIAEVLTSLKHDPAQPYEMLYDLTAIDERVRHHRQGQPRSDFTLVYHLLSFSRNEDLRLKVPLAEGESVPT